MPIDHLRLAAPWIWFVLPQLRGLGTSHNATYYGIENAAEAAAYLAHPVLGARLRECVAAIMAHKDKSAHAMLGSSSRAQRAPAVVTHSAPMDRRSGANHSVDHLRLAASSPDDAKFRSCLTLFRAVAAPDDSLWQSALIQFYAGQPDDATLRLLAS